MAKKSNAQKVRDYEEKNPGKTPAAVAKATGVKIGTVYNVRSNGSINTSPKKKMAKKKSAKRKTTRRGLPPGQINIDDAKSMVVCVEQIGGDIGYARQLLEVVETIRG